LTEENLAEIYWSKLLTEPNRAKVLAQFYCALFGSELTSEIIMSFARYTKIYGVDIVYYSLVDAFVVKDIRDGDARGLVNYFAKQRLEDKKTKSNVKDLSESIEGYDKRTNKIKKLKLHIKDPFND
jgi:hypothetical protein